MDHDHYPYTDGPQHVNHEERLASHKNHSKLLIPIIILIVAVLVVGGLSFAYLRVGKQQCTYKGITYNVGDGFPSEDGCNSCSCTYDEQSKTSQVACTLMACGDDISDPTADWETFRNEEYGYTLQYIKNSDLQGYFCDVDNNTPGIEHLILAPATPYKSPCEFYEGIGPFEVVIEKGNVVDKPYNPPTRTSDITVDGIAAKQYDWEPPEDDLVGYGPYTEIRVFHANRTYVILFNDQKLGDQILSTFRFLDKGEQ